MGVSIFRCAPFRLEAAQIQDSGVSHGDKNSKSKADKQVEEVVAAGYRCQPDQGGEEEEKPARRGNVKLVSAQGPANSRLVSHKLKSPPMDEDLLTLAASRNLRNGERSRWGFKKNSCSCRFCPSPGKVEIQNRTSLEEINMAGKLIDGKHWASVIRGEIKEATGVLTKKNRSPGLGVILVGDHAPSRIYVTRKEEACEEVGIRSVESHLPETCTTEDILEKVAELNADDSIDGILVQLPLPDQADERKVLMAVSPDKDVDGLHPVNAGRLFVGQPRFVPCTPLGVMELLHRENVPIKGARAVVVGRSNLVGKPMAMLLLAEHATVTLCHSRTEDLGGVCREGDILVGAVGQPEMIQGSWVKPGAVVLDVGTTRKEQGEGKKAKLVGDVQFEEASKNASMITPVPGGVGPMTIAMLLKNTLQSAQWRLGVG